MWHHLSFWLNGRIFEAKHACYLRTVRPREKPVCGRGLERRVSDTPSAAAFVPVCRRPGGLFTLKQSPGSVLTDEVAQSCDARAAGQRRTAHAAVFPSDCNGTEKFPSPSDLVAVVTPQ